MEFKEVVKEAFVMVGYSAPGSWGGDVSYPIPGLWEKAKEFITRDQADQIIGVCLPPRSDDYYYTCGIEMDSAAFRKMRSELTVHTFPKQKYVVFKHTGPSGNIPETYHKLWKVFDQGGYLIEKGMPEIEVVDAHLFGKEDSNEYEMDIWIPVGEHPLL
ncbi:AraC family transcriptional regulator [Bacillus sp. AFS015802]|uniref:GyrI-like domain-containing protein n=1 Tax=Bacillus sp. AFS015802 TaxID=2033486 RepID=UPI000BF50DC4|nr:GyrI-like domain-containing protein [Bacillus sp. AFS015802]PFA63362.1 AraC family transcriptional regulator [Bacillus sp. AFS015802]